MSAQQFESVLARLYVDEAFLTSFLVDPASALANDDLTDDEIKDLLKVDRVGLVMAAESFRRKRAKRPKRRSGFLRRFLSRFRI